MPLTAKQQAQVAKASPSQRASLKAAFTRRNKEADKRAAPRTLARPSRPAKPAPVPRRLTAAFDGFDKFHLPLDEVTAPYTTTNLISVMEFGSSPSMDQVIVVCPRVTFAQEIAPGQLNDYIAVRYDANETISGGIESLDSVRSPVVGAPPLGGALTPLSVRARLHNLSARLSCLGTNTGLYPPGSVYMGTVPMLETDYRSTGSQESLKIKTAWADDSIAVGYIRPIAASALQECPATINSAIAENVSYKMWRDFSLPTSSMLPGSLSFLTAMEPIVLYIPRAGAGDTVVNYRLEIGQQWCTRHPHDIMLRATQKSHSATPPNEWHKAISFVKDVGEHLLNRAGNVAVDALANRARVAMLADAA